MMTAIILSLLALEHSQDIYFKPLNINGKLVYVEPWRQECFLGPNHPNFKNLSEEMFREAAIKYLEESASKDVAVSLEKAYNVVELETGNDGFIDEEYGTTIAILENK